MAGVHKLLHGCGRVGGASARSRHVLLESGIVVHGRLLQAGHLNGTAGSLRIGIDLWILIILIVVLQHKRWGHLRWGRRHCCRLSGLVIRLHDFGDRKLQRTCPLGALICRGLAGILVRGGTLHDRTLRGRHHCDFSRWTTRLHATRTLQWKEAIKMGLKTEYAKLSNGLSINRRTRLLCLCQKPHSSG